MWLRYLLRYLHIQHVYVLQVYIKFELLMQYAMIDEHRELSSWFKYTAILYII